MPFKLKTRCRFPGCPELVKGHPFCDQHRKHAYRRQDERRGTPAQRGYDHDWKRVAEQRRELDAHLCQQCRQQDRFTPAKIVDHIIPLHVRPEWRLELGNTQVICITCHQRKTTRDTDLYGSSAAERLTTGQLEARAEAKRMPEPPRATGDG
jgi:5-methylcytosine-specific restriction protein A